jgi:hypothetical protein
MVDRIQKKYNKFVFSDKTYNILNYATLQISDSEIRRQYDLARCGHFDDLFKPMAIGFSIYFIYRVI